ncbi:MAG: HEPN domain-containing protein [Solirubrobacteraceae bacterium]
MPRRDNIDVARILLRKGIEDETLVRTVADNHDIADAIVGFHAQQAIEKYAKAVLTAHGVEYAKRHDLDYLIDLVQKQDIAAPEQLSASETLSAWAVESRYDEAMPALDRSATLAFLSPLRTWAEQEIQTCADPAEDPGIET